MTNHPPKYRRPLNQHQIKLIQSLYKFRFATAQLIAKSQASKPRVILARLKILVDQDYTGQNYNSSYKIKGKPATYFLRLGGIRYLKQQSYANKRVLDSVYHDKRASDPVIAHYLHVFNSYTEFKRLYVGKLKFYSKSEMASRKHMPSQLPDAYISLEDDKDGSARHFFLECFEDATEYRRLVNKIRQHINYAENDDWKSAFTSSPAILMVCESIKLKRRMIRIAERELQSSIADLQFLTTKRDQLSSSLDKDQAIWNDVTEPEKLLSI